MGEGGGGRPPSSTRRKTTALCHMWGASPRTCDTTPWRYTTHVIRPAFANLWLYVAKDEHGRHSVIRNQTLSTLNLDIALDLDPCLPRQTLREVARAKLYNVHLNGFGMGLGLETNGCRIEMHMQTQKYPQHQLRCVSNAQLRVARPDC